MSRAVLVVALRGTLLRGTLLRGTLLLGTLLRGTLLRGTLLRGTLLLGTLLRGTLLLGTLTGAARLIADDSPRVPWTSSRVVGSPDPPPPYKPIVAFPNIKLNHPLLLANCPGSDRLFVGEQDARLYSFPNRPDARLDVFFDIPKELKTLGQTPNAGSVESVYGLVFHPKFTENRTCFICYTLRGKKGEANLADGTRLSRFRVTPTDPPRVDPASEEILLTFLQGGHNGGDLHFGPDDYLYVSTGDAAAPNPPDALRTGQDCSDLLSSVLRIDVNKPTGYGIPPDNPFVDTPGVRPEIWAFGFRNPWRMSFDRATGDLWLGDVGWELWEMVHKVEKGGNYGWSITEARQPIHPNGQPGPIYWGNPGRVSPAPIAGIRPPVIEIPHTAGASVTGGYVYRGKRFPELVGTYVFGDWETRRLWGARFENGRVTAWPEIAPATVRTTAMGEDRDGELYFLDYDAGTIHTLTRNDTLANSAAFPRRLSQTGLFASSKDHVPAPGVYPFTVNVHQWQDHATAEHLIALPGTTAVTDYEEKKPIPGNVHWHSFRYHFPQNAVLVKTISMELETGQPATRRRLETQVLHFADGFWQGYTYAWRDDQTDADLVPAEGGEKPLTIADPSFPGGKRPQTWTFHSRSQCLQCHNAWSEYSLAFNPEQLNRGNQLAQLGRLGLLQRVGKGDQPKSPYTVAEAAHERRLANPHDTTTPVGDRATAYLHVNCGVCHRFGGGGTTNIDLSAFDRRKEMKELAIPPRLGGFDLTDPKVLTPGHPERSVLYYRMAKFGRGRMPHIGSEWPDERGLALVHEWIAGSAGGPTPPPSTVALASPTTALPVARAVGRNSLRSEVRSQVLTTAAASNVFTVRDLFEGYLPQTGERKLGPTPRPQAILARTGDPTRGRELFFNPRFQCINCHKLEGQGTELGPNLADVGKRKTRGELLESLLEPSRRIEPKFQPYLLKTTDGRVATGLLVRRDGQEVVLRDAQNKDMSASASLVESLTPGRESIMPTGTLADLTAQQAADLLAFLASRKETP